MESGYRRTPSNLPVLDQPQSSDVDLLVKNSRWRSWGQNILHVQLLAQVPAVSTCSRLSRMPAYLNMKTDKIIAEEPVSSFTPMIVFDSFYLWLSAVIRCSGFSLILRPIAGIVIAVNLDPHLSLLHPVTACSTDPSPSRDWTLGKAVLRGPKICNSATLTHHTQTGSSARKQLHWLQLRVEILSFVL